MRKIFSVAIFIFLLANIYAVRINEVELNPEDGTYGKEWVELYNDEDMGVDVSGWEIYDGYPKKRFTIPEGTFIDEEDFYVAEFSSAVLNNDGDSVILYDSDGEEIDRTDTFEDFDWSYETWQLCDSWEFAEATKGEENDCEVEEEAEEDNEIKEIEDNNPEKEKDEENKTPEVINLNPKNIKSKETRKSLDGNYAKYGFVAFCVLLGLLFVLKKKPKNEFK